MNNITNVINKQGFERMILPFGHGDGGGGPTPAMLEKARRIKDVAGLPETYYTTVSDFMKTAEEVEGELPTYAGELYLELHRGGTHPDVTGDKGVHEMTYSFLPHNAPFSVDSVVKPAYLLNVPAIAACGQLKEKFTPILGIDADNVICEAIKPAELVSGAWVARFYEAERCRTNAKLYVGKDVRKAYRTNILEDVKYELAIVDGTVEYSFRPFEIATFMFVK